MANMGMFDGVAAASASDAAAKKPGVA